MKHKCHYRHTIEITAEGNVCCEQFAIFPLYTRTRITENGEKVSMRGEIRDHYGFNDYCAHWTCDSDTYDEDFILVGHIMKEDALRLGKEYGVSGMIFKEGTQVSEICTTPTDGYAEGETIRTWQSSEAALFTKEEIVTCFKNRTLRPLGNESSLDEVYYIHPARPSMFSGPRPELIYKKEQ